jgi:hypothetical protein
MCVIEEHSHAAHREPGWLPKDRRDVNVIHIRIPTVRGMEPLTLHPTFA